MLQFLFDAVFDEESSNEHIYSSTLRSLVPGIFEKGGAVTCFAYGQTGSGKTYTMTALHRYCVEDIFHLADGRFRGVEIAVSFFEIYMAKVVRDSRCSRDVGLRCRRAPAQPRASTALALTPDTLPPHVLVQFDLLGGRRETVIREDGNGNVQVVGLVHRVVHDVDSLMRLVSAATQARRTGTTTANADSSRSHAVLRIEVRHGGARLGQLSLVDLAGNERGADTANADRETRLEGAEINRSLLALKECIRALDQQASHTPFRGSKLTQVLRDSFIGRKARTVMIATVSPPSKSVENSLNTLRYVCSGCLAPPLGPRWSDATLPHFPSQVRGTVEGRGWAWQRWARRR